MRDGFVIHDKTMQQARFLSEADRGYLFDCLIEYHTTGNIDIDEVAKKSSSVAIVLIDFCERYENDAKIYEAKAEAGKKGSGTRWNNDKPIAGDNRPIADDSKAITDDSRPIADDNRPITEDSLSVSVSDSVSVSVKENKARAKRPTLEEVRAYCEERGNKVDPEAFVAYYDSQNWKKANGQPLTNWKSAVVTWEKREQERNKAAPAKKNTFTNFEQREYDDKALERAIYGTNRSGCVYA